jgi:ATP/maltotriose-dependent transcriptional regulator MalT
VLLEREAELAVIRNAARAAAAGAGQLVVIEGEAGIGKTSLLGRLGDLPEWSGNAIFTARGSDLESRYAYGVVRQLFEPLTKPLSGAAAQAGHVFDPGQADGEPSEVATLHGLFWLTANTCSGPIALVIDDLHWADTASLRYLTYLQPRIPEMPLLVLAAMRLGEAAADDLLLARITSDPATTLVRPAPLSAEASGELLTSRLGRAADERFAEASYRATSGNPLLIRALAGTLRQAGVDPVGANAGQVLGLGYRAVSRAVALRLAGVPEATTAVARALAVLGQDARTEMVGDLAGLDPITAAESIAELVAMGLVEGEDRVGFVHPLVAAAVYGDIGVRERAEAHARAADVLDKAGASAEQVGVHLLKVPPGTSPGAADRLRRAAAMARTRGSAEAAYTFLERCLHEPGERRALLAETAAVAIQVDLRAAAGLLAEARALARDPAERARLGLQLGNAYGLVLDPDSAVAAFVAARDEAPPGEEDLRRRLEATLLVGSVIVPGRLGLADGVPELRDLPPHDSIGGRMLEATIGMHLMRQAIPDGVRRATEALADGELVRTMNGEGALVAGWLVLIAADDPAALASLDAAMVQAHLNGSLRALAAAHCFRSMGRLWTGQLADAESDARAALDMAGSGRVDIGTIFAGAYLAGALAERGEVDEAERLVHSLGVPAAEPGDLPRYYLLDVWARILLLRGRYDEAFAAARVAGRVWQEYGFDNPALACWRTVGAEAAYRIGNPDEARDLLAADLEQARRWAAPRGLSRVLRTIGTLTGDEDVLREAVDLVEDSPARLERAAALLDLGSAVRRSGRRAESRDLLGRALDDAEFCGAVPLADRAATELRVAGFRPRRNRLTGPAALTPSELRVAELAAAGSSNREIAQALFVTTKTVELHLSNAYRKLGVSGRRNLAAALEP